MPGSDRRSWPPEGTPAARVVGGLFRSRNYVWDNDHRIVASYGVTWTQFLTLMALRSAGPDFVLSPTKLYDATQASSGGMTKMLHGLADKDYIRRVPNPEDKRSKLVQLTDTGADLAEEIVDRLIATNTELFGSILSDEECTTLAGLLQKLSKGLQDKK